MDGGGRQPGVMCMYVHEWWMNRWMGGEWTTSNSESRTLDGCMLDRWMHAYNHTL